MSLDYLGKLKVGADSNFIDQSFASAATVGIATTVGGAFDSTSLYVEGQTRLVGVGSTALTIIGNTEITGIISVSAASTDSIYAANGLYFDNSNGTLTVRNIVIKGNTTGVTASGVGLTVKGGPQDFGTNYVLNFDKNLLVSANAGVATVGTASSLFNIDAIGIGTEVPRSVLDVQENDDNEIPPWIIPANITDEVRDTYDAIAGAIIFNTTANKHQGYGSTDGGATFDWHNMY